MMSDIWRKIGGSSINSVFMTAGVFIIHLYIQKIQPPFEIGIIRAGWIFLSVLYKKL